VYSDSGSGQLSGRTDGVGGGRIWDDLPWAAHRVSLIYPQRRVRCRTCGIRTERVTFADPKARITRRLPQVIGLDCQSMPTSHAAVRHGVSWTFKAFRSGASYQKVLHNASKLGAIRRALPEPKFNLGFSMTLFRENLEEIPDVLRVVAEVGGNFLKADIGVIFSKKELAQSVLKCPDLYNEIYAIPRSRFERSPSQSATASPMSAPATTHPQ
jgi:hypothetical protein